MSVSKGGKKVLAAVLAVIVVVAVASGVLIYQSNVRPTVTPVMTTQSEVKVKLSLSHVAVVGAQPLPLASMLWPSMLAAKLGFYDKYGLTVDSVGTSGSLEALAAIVTGKAEFGQLGVGVGVPTRGNGTDVKYVFMTQERDPAVVYTFEKSGIKTAKDLEGKTVGVSFATAEYNTMPLFAKAAGFDYKKVKYVNISPAQYITYLVSGQVDATIQYPTDYYNYEAAATKVGQKLAPIFRYDYLDIYGAGIATTGSFIKQHPDVAKVFTEGYAYGLQYIIDKAKDASVLLTGMMSGSDQESVYNKARTYAEFKTVLPRLAGQPYGIMDDKIWNATINVMVQYLGAKTVTPNEMYTNEYIPTQYVPKAQMMPAIIAFYEGLYGLPDDKPASSSSLLQSF